MATAFKIFENRLNEVRDNSKNASVAGASGGTLVRDLYRFGILHFPFPGIAPVWQVGAEDGLKNLLSGALGFIRNPYDHAPHTLPELDEKSCLELLFFASFLLRMIDQSK